MLPFFIYLQEIPDQVGDDGKKVGDDGKKDVYIIILICGYEYKNYHIRF